MAKKRERAPGSGSVYPRKDGKWVAEVPVGRGSRTYRQRRYLYAATEKEAKRRLAEALGALELGMAPPDPRLTVGAHLHDWLEWQRQRVASNSLRSSTWTSYEGHVRIHLASLHGTPLIRLAANDVRRMVSRLIAGGMSPTTVRYSVTVLRMALKQAVNDGLVLRNVASSVQPPKVVRTDTSATLTMAQAERLLAAAEGDSLGPLWTLALATGLRQGELLGLRWVDIDMEAETLRITGALRPIPVDFREGGPRLQRVDPKSDHGFRVVPILLVRATQALRVLKSADKSAFPTNLEGYVFTTPRGTPLDGRNVYRQWQRFVADHGLPRIRFHDLRHSTVSILRALGISMDDIRPIIGHGSIEQTWDYNHTLPEVWTRARTAMQGRLG